MASVQQTPLCTARPYRLFAMQINIEEKIRNIRFMGELVKFRVCPEPVILRYLSKCLDDFTHHNIDVACTLLDTCGKFLYRNPASHTRTNNLLSQMMRLRSIKTLDPRHETLVDGAFFSTRPNESRHKQFRKV